jgi:hypothetical protein
MRASADAQRAQGSRSEPKASEDDPLGRAKARLGL